MKKLLSLVLVIAFGFATASAMACPKGETMTDGTGKHHKGGTCAPKVVKDAAPMAKTQHQQRNNLAIKKTAC